MLKEGNESQNRVKGGFPVIKDSPDELQRGGDHEEEGNGNDVTCDASSRHETDGDWILHTNNNV
jgi:hypothetical protein